MGAEEKERRRSERIGNKKVLADYPSQDTISRGFELGSVEETG